MGGWNRRFFDEAFCNVDTVAMVRVIVCTWHFDMVVVVECEQGPRGFEREGGGGGWAVLKKNAAGRAMTSELDASFN